MRKQEIWKQHWNIQIYFRINSFIHIKNVVKWNSTGTYEVYTRIFLDDQSYVQKNVEYDRI